MSPASESYRQQREEAGRLIRSGDLDRAQTILHDLLRANSEDAQSWHLLGTIHYRKGERASAVEAFRRELRLSPDDPVAYYSLAISLPEDERDDAAALLRKTLQLKPDFAAAKRHLTELEKASSRSYREVPAPDPTRRVPSPIPSPRRSTSTPTPAPGPPVLTESHGPIRGQARTIQHRTETDPWLARTSFIIWSLRVDRWDDEGNPLSPVPVEIRGRRIEGALVEGDWVEVPGRWRPGETLQTHQITNLSTGAVVKARGDTARRFQLTILVVFILAFLAFAAWVGYNLISNRNSVDEAGRQDGPGVTGGGQVDPPSAPPDPTDETTTDAPPSSAPVNIRCVPEGAPTEHVISVGDSVTWVNGGDESMELTSDPQPTNFTPQSLDPGGEFALTLTDPGTYKYGCLFSSGAQTGQVIVERV